MGAARVFSYGAAGALVLVACVKFSPEVKQTFEPQSAQEHSNFEPRKPPYGPIYVGVLPDAGTDASTSPDATRPEPAPTPAEGGAP